MVNWTYKNIANPLWALIPSKTASNVEQTVELPPFINANNAHITSLYWIHSTINLIQQVTCINFFLHHSWIHSFPIPVHCCALCLVLIISWFAIGDVSSRYLRLTWNLLEPDGHIPAIHYPPFTITVIGGVTSLITGYSNVCLTAC